jgi:uncharacterized protein (TIGR03435 family)
MKRYHETNSKDLDRLLRLHARPDSSDMEAAIDDVLKRDGARIGECLAGEQPAVSRLRYGPRVAVAAAVLIGMVGIGLYAVFPVQRESAPPAVPPTQVAAVTQGTDAGAARLQLPRLKFAAASVRPHPQPGPGVPATFGPIKCLGADGLLWAPQDGDRTPPPRRGRCTGPAVFLGSLLRTAYASSTIARLTFPPDVKFRPQVVPASAEVQALRGNRDASFVTIEAVADDPERVTKGELKLMLQTLLEDRFKARVHTETRELDGYVVTIAKSGIKFKETSGETRIVAGSGSPRLTGNYTMEQVAQFLSNMLSGIPPAPAMPVLDKTGLTGTYAINFRLEEILPAAVAAAQAQAGVRGGGRGSTDPRQFTTPVPKAVEDELGLHEERAKVPVEFIVIDNLEPLTEN